MFSVPSGEGGSGSFSGPALAGVLGLVLSWGSDAAEAGEISTPLSGPEALQLLISTASDVADPNSSWAPKAGFDLHFGYGRPNAHKALQAAAEGRIPPLAWIESPQWYSLFDPTQSDILVVEGHVSAPRSAEYEYVLEYALGAEPSEDDFIEAGRGRGSEAFEGELGRIDLSKIPEEFWGQAMRLSTTKQLETTEQYTVTLRLRVLDAAGVEGVDRRTVSVLHDPSWWPGFPMRFGQSGESQPLMVDLQGLGHLALVFGDSEGFVHAIDPMTQQELPGFPVRSLPHADHQTGHATLHEGFINNLAIADLDGHGELSIVGTSSAGRVYIWSAQGQLRPGWPKLLLSDVTRPSVPRGHTPLQRFAIDGAIAPPVLYDMNGDGRLDIIQAAWDGHLYVLDSAGNALPGWPVAVALDNPAPPPGYQFLDDRKLSAPPTLADLDGDGSPELVIRNQQAYTLGAGIQPFPRTHVFAYHADGRPVDGFPVDAQGLFLFHGGSPEFILEGLHTPAAADIDGDGDDEFSFSPGLFSPTYLMDGDGSEIRLFGPTPDALLGIANSPESLPDVINRNLASDVPVNFATTGVFGRFGAANQLSYMEPGSGGVSIAAALMLAGSGVNVSNYMRAHDPLTGAAHPGFPSKSQGLHFLAAPVIADVTGDGATEIISAADSSTLHGYDVSGAQAAGFPKYTGGWSVFAPAVGDIDGDGTVEIAGITREGVLFVWKTAGLASANNEWWGFRHDEQNTGRYGEDTRPPGVPRDVRFDAETAQLSFLAPGDNWYSGQAADYLLQLSNGEELIHTSTVAAGQREQIKLSPQVRALSLFARDTSGLRSRSVYLHDSQPGQTDDPTQSSRSSRGGVLAWNMLILLGSLLIWRQRRF